LILSAVRYWLVMPAAGTGQRFGGLTPKQYASLNARTVIEWALSSFVSDTRCVGIAVALAPEDHWWPRIADRLPAVTVVAGGSERSVSVRNALSALSRRADADDWVLIHDAARPCLLSQDKDRLIAEASASSTGGLLACPSVDTLKRAGVENVSEETVDRIGLWRAQTPQMFRYGRLCEALDHAFASRRFPTDDAQALEWLGERPLLVEGSPFNIKITRPEDLLLAAALLSGRSGP
jgi:2-C-methyl-D-erythritol 4-phosphate cytidylyltransferase